jgi:hypothetical protein
MEMRYFWVCDNIVQDAYNVKWHPRQENLADYQSKHHPGAHHHAVGPFAQARDAAQQKEEEEHADHNLRKVTIKRRKKRLHSSIKTDIMRLRNGSYLAPMNVYLSWSSKEIHMISYVVGLSNTKHLCRNAVLH